MLFPGQNVRRTNNKLLSPSRAGIDNDKQTILLTKRWNNICAHTARFHDVPAVARDPNKQRANTTRETRKKKNNEINFRSVCRARCEITRTLSLSLSFDPASGGTLRDVSRSKASKTRKDTKTGCAFNTRSCCARRSARSRALSRGRARPR